MSQEFTTYRSVFDKSEYIKQGQIITYDNLNSVDDLPELSTLERQDIYHARTGNLSSDYIVPVDTDESGSFDEWRSLVDGGNLAIPDSEVDYFERDNFTDKWSQFEGSYSIDTDDVFEGTRSVRLTSGEASAGSAPGDGLPNYPEIGDRVLVRIMHKDSNSSPHFDMVSPTDGSDDRYEGIGIGFSSRDDHFSVVYNGNSEPDTESISYSTDEWYLGELNTRFDNGDVEYRAVLYDGPTLEDDELVTLTDTVNVDRLDDGVMIHDHFDGEEAVYDRIIVGKDVAVFE